MSKKQKIKENIMVGSKTRDVVKSQGLNMSGDFVEALSSKSHDLIEQAAERAKANGRKTIRPSDL